MECISRVRKSLQSKAKKSDILGPPLCFQLLFLKLRHDRTSHPISNKSTLTAMMIFFFIVLLFFFRLNFVVSFVHYNKRHPAVFISLRVAKIYRFRAISLRTIAKPSCSRVKRSRIIALDVALPRPYQVSLPTTIIKPCQ